MNVAPQRTGAKNLRTLASGKMAGMRCFCWRREWRTAAGLLLLLPLYGVSMPPETVFEDAGMLAAVCRDFGLPHPPGYPLYAILCPPFSHALGAMTLNPAQAAAWMSALFAAGACAMFYEICRRLSAPPWRALALALTLGAGARFWSQAVIAEVYTLNALLVAATVAMIFRLLQKPNARRFWHLCFAAGLGLSAHWPLYLAHAPVFLLLLSPLLAKKKNALAPAVAQNNHRRGGDFNAGLVALFVFVVAADVSADSVAVSAAVQHRRSRRLHRPRCLRCQGWCRRRLAAMRRRRAVVAASFADRGMRC